MRLFIRIIYLFFFTYEYIMPQVNSKPVFRSLLRSIAYRTPFAQNRYQLEKRANPLVSSQLTRIANVGETVRFQQSVTNAQHIAGIYPLPPRK